LFVSMCERIGKEEKWRGGGGRKGSNLKSLPMPGRRRSEG
jgi:hypothetical protein